MGGVISSIVTAIFQSMSKRGRENIIAPMTKSIWSTIGNKPPGAMSSLLLRKAAVKSPKSAPKGVSTANRIGKEKILAGTK